LEKYQNRPAESNYKNRLGEPVRTLSKSYHDGRLVKMITDTLKPSIRGKGNWVQRTIEMMSEGGTIMSNIQRFVQEEILDMEIDESNCFSITESLKGASILDIDEAECIMDAVRTVYKSYCHDIAGNIRAMRDGYISQDDFNNSLENILSISDDRLRAISTDRAALAYAAYVLSLENGYGSQSFPFLTVLDGMVALLDNVKTTDYYDFSLRREIPRNIAHLLNEASHIIVYSNKCRLPENVDPSKTYFGDVALANGSYEIHRDLKGGVSLIIPKPAQKDRLNLVPFNDSAEFSLKVSYKASELLPEHQNGEYVTELMDNNAVTFKETTMTGNTQYCVYVGDVWVGIIFDDQTNGWVLRKEIAKTLMGKDYALKCVPRTGVKTDTNSFTTGTGKARTAQILTFIAQAKPVRERLPLAV
jgi:hypothetical protein